MPRLRSRGKFKKVIMRRIAVTGNTDSVFSSRDYLFSIVWSDEDDAFVARVLEFPSLAAHGPTSEDALGEIRTLVEDVLDELIEGGEPLPEPLSRKQFSGKLNLRMPSTLHRELSIEAAREGVSLNQWITIKLARETVAKI